MTIKNVPWTAMPVYTEYLWKVTGDGWFFHDFYVPGKTYGEARARAQDILAGCTANLPKDGKRFYGTVDSHIKSIVQQPGLRVEGNYHEERLVMLDTNREETT